MRKSWVLAGIGIALAVAGCDRGTAVVGLDDAHDDCETQCKHDDSCSDVETDIEGCTSDCVESISGWFRADASKDLAECVDHLSCDDDDAICNDRINPLPIHRTWSGKCTMQLAICDGIDPDVCAVDIDEAPDSNTRFIAEPIMKRLIKCLDAADCDARLTCTNDILDAFGMQL